MAMKESTDLKYIHQDHLSGTAVVTSDGGTPLGTTSYYPYGSTRESTGTPGTDKLFTGQRLDDTGLYYYNARYYDPQIGRFISADTVVQWSTGVDVVSYALTVNAITTELGSLSAPQGNYPAVTLQVPRNPENLNRYSYVLNNPLRYTDPFGRDTEGDQFNFNAAFGIGFSFEIGIVKDDKGNVAWVVSLAFLGGTPSASAGYQYQHTDAGLNVIPSPGGYLLNSQNQSSEIVLKYIHIDTVFSDKQYVSPWYPLHTVNPREFVLEVSGSIQNNHAQYKEIAMYAEGCDEAGEQVAWTLDAAFWGPGAAWE